MSEMEKKTEAAEDSAIDEKRRNFLRKSAYAAYATPVIVALLVNKVQATPPSWANNDGDKCDPPGWGE